MLQWAWIWDVLPLDLGFVGSAWPMGLAGLIRWIDVADEGWRGSSMVRPVSWLGRAEDMAPPSQNYVLTSWARQAMAMTLVSLVAFFLETSSRCCARLLPRPRRRKPDISAGSDGGGVFVSCSSFGLSFLEFSPVGGTSCCVRMVMMLGILWRLWG